MNYSNLSSRMMARIQLIDEFVRVVAPDLERQWSSCEAGAGLTKVKLSLRYEAKETLLVIAEDAAGELSLLVGHGPTSEASSASPGVLAQGGDLSTVRRSKKERGPDRQEWYTAINKHNSGALGTRKFASWMYDGMKMRSEIPRMTRLLLIDGEQPSAGRGRLSCCLGVPCSACEHLKALDAISGATAGEIAEAKAWTCASHIVRDGGDIVNEGYFVTPSDRAFWDRVCESLSATADEYASSRQR